MPIENIVIVGGGVAGWLAAAALARRTQCNIVVVETPGIDDSLGLPLKVEATLPSTPAFHQALGLDEDYLLAKSGGSFTLGRALSNWTASQTPSFHPFGEIGAGFGPIAFHQLVAKLRAEGDAVNLANYSVAALCAQSGRFARPSSDTRSVLSTMAYGLHLETDRYRDAIKADALMHGVTALDGDVRALTLSESLLIESISLIDGRHINGDLFLDCTGQSRALIRRMPGAAFDDWSHWLPCDRCVVTTSAAVERPLPYTHVDAHESGWRSLASAQNVVSDALVYQNNAAERDAYSFTSGRVAAPWTGNCLAIGGAAAINDPVASTQLHLAISAILRLLTLFPHDQACLVESAEYNRQTIEELENARDFAIVHYKANGRIGIGFWDTCRAMEVPDRLGHRIDLYTNTGRLALYDGETFEAPDWVALFDALDARPRSYDVMADAIEPARIADYLHQVRTAMLKAVATVAPHSDYLENIRPSA